MDVKKLSDESIEEMLKGLQKENQRRYTEKQKIALVEEQKDLSRFCEDELDPLIVDLRVICTSNSEITTRLTMSRKTISFFWTVSNEPTL